MKKKIGELTLKEAKKICKKNSGNKCECCPLSTFTNCKLWNGHYYNEEVEVDDE